MSTEEREDVINTKLWFEKPVADNPFAADTCYCAGYDVYGDLLGKASWVEYLYLLFRLEKPSHEHAKLLEMLAIVLANPGPRDHSVRAAMNGGVGGSLSASCLMAALGPGAGGFGGAHELFLAMEQWAQYGTNIDAWRKVTDSETKFDLEVWPDIEHIPGFDPYGSSTTAVVLTSLNKLAFTAEFSRLHWLASHRMALEEIAGSPLSIISVVSAAFADLGFEAEQAEMLYLLLRLPGAAAHALEQRHIGHKRYPFFRNGLKLKAVTPQPPTEKG